MQNILVPTDFSDCAKAAEDLAMQLAKEFGGIVHLYHNYKSKDEEDEVMRKLRERANSLEDSYPGIRIEMHASMGKLVSGVEGITDQMAIDFLVIGSYGASGKAEYFIGSNAQKMVRSVHLPVLVIKEKIKNLKFKKVIFASNFNEKEKEPFRRFLAIVKSFNPKVYLVNIDTPSLFDAPYIVQREAMEDFKEIAQPLESEIKMIRHFSVDAGVRLFSIEINADMIAISNHNRRPVKRIMTGSNVEALINHTDIPILTIDYKPE